VKYRGELKMRVFAPGSVQNTVISFARATPIDFTYDGNENVG